MPSVSDTGQLSQRMLPAQDATFMAQMKKQDAL